MTTVTLDGLDAVELAEILEFFVERLDVLAEHDLTAPLFGFDRRSPYGTDDLRADVARLTHRLLGAPPTTGRPAPHPSTDVVLVEVDRGSASARGRPPDRTWLVRLRRGDQSVIVTIGLSRPAADHPADRVVGVLGPMSAARP